MPTALKEDIALRATKGGKIVPAVRKSGIFVPKEFAAYKNFKDAKVGAFGGTKDITRLIQEIDGALPVEKLAQLPGQAGPAVRNILWRTRDMMKQSIGFSGSISQKLKRVVGNIKPKSPQSIQANKVLERLTSTASKKSVDDILKLKSISRITKDKDVVRFAKEARVYFDDLLDFQNIMRAERNQKLIPKRKYYSPHEIQKYSLWEKTFGLRKEPVDIMRKPGLPDYIHPDKPFNPRELARTFGLKEFQRDMDLVTLLDNYSRTAVKDIFSTSIVQNNKAFAQQFETMGFKNASRNIEDWTTEAFAGLKAKADRTASLAPTIEKGMRWWRQQLVRNVFPLNFAWNTFVQTSSATLTTARYGVKNTLEGAFKWASNPEWRADILKNAYSQIIKSQKIGKITYQDINQGVIRADKINKGKLESVIDAANYFTEWTERHLTGISISSAYQHGKKIGLKGKALWEYASDGGAKTQSMYNMEDLPGILRANIVKTAAPFQTFSFEVFNTMREFAGKTGVPPADFQKRMGWVLRFMAGAYATNMIANKAIGRDLWDAGAFIPFYGNFVNPAITAISKGKFGATYETARGLPAPTGAALELANGLNKAITKGDYKKLRQVVVRYGMPFAGTQTNRVIDGIQAISDMGVKDSSGKMLFPVLDTKDQVRAIFSGPWTTSGGQKYLEKRE